MQRLRKCLECKHGRKERCQEIVRQVGKGRSSGKQLVEGLIQQANESRTEDLVAAVLVSFYFLIFFIYTVSVFQKIFVKSETGTETPVAENSVVQKTEGKNIETEEQSPESSSSEMLSESTLKEDVVSLACSDLTSADEGESVDPLQLNNLEPIKEKPSAPRRSTRASAAQDTNNLDEKTATRKSSRAKEAEKASKKVAKKPKPPAKAKENVPSINTSRRVSTRTRKSTKLYAP